jgi:uncharacterized membrane protein YgcG
MNEQVAWLSGKLATLLGVSFVAFGVLLALLSLVVDVPWGQLTGKAVLEQSITLVFLVLAGMLGGVPLVILGQIILVLMRQNDVLERIAETLEQRGSGAREHDSGASPGGSRGEGLRSGAGGAALR